MADRLAASVYFNRNFFSGKNAREANFQLGALKLTIKGTVPLRIDLSAAVSSLEFSREAKSRF